MTLKHAFGVDSNPLLVTSIGYQRNKKGLLQAGGELAALKKYLGGEMVVSKGI